MSESSTTTHPTPPDAYHDLPRETRSRRPSGWDIALGVLLVLASLFLLANAVFATVLSVFLIAWTALIGGVVMVIHAIVNRKSESVWLGVISGVILAVLGVVMLANPGIGIVALTMLAGAGFLASGIIRLILATSVPSGRGWLIFGGVVALLLGLFVLLNFAEATFTLLGILVGVTMLVDGITMLAGGRTTVARV